MIDKAKGYGMESLQIDGNNIVEVYTKISELDKSVRENPRPVLVEFLTFRMRGHEEASGTKYVPKELLKSWAQKDPVQNYYNYLLNNKLITIEEDINFRAEINKEINDNLAIAFAEEPIIASLENELQDVYNPQRFKEIAVSSVICLILKCFWIKNNNISKITFLQFSTF